MQSWLSRIRTEPRSGSPGKPSLAAHLSTVNHQKVKAAKGTLPGRDTGYFSAATFGFVIGTVSRCLFTRDRIIGRAPRSPLVDPAQFSVERVVIPSENTLLDGVLVRPVSGPLRGASLICHGIAETVEYWTPVQLLLASEGVASLVFDYSGYGGSPGWITPGRCEADTIGAFEFFRASIPSLPISLLGFSLGSGIAAVVLPHLPVHRMVLCAAFTSFQAAAFRTGWPRLLSGMVPDIWRTEECLRDCTIPVLLVQGEKDRLFPVQMAQSLREACGANATLVVAAGVTHDSPYYRPHPDYWRLISNFLLGYPIQEAVNSSRPGE